ncbi:hypothetical protein AVEN_178374-1 [Araneus ventricosus]|uniref:Uncharacterized protein n=1 Tax=Araneus ventricosus TaxID=182803 RepID=A0A4Y2BCN5_ARAVE|nr:hypothetical protein AVEN_178374-1 [Araneus ventricosus]
MAPPSQQNQSVWFRSIASNSTSRRKIHNLLDLLQRETSLFRPDPNELFFPSSISFLNFNCPSYVFVSSSSHHPFSLKMEGLVSPDQHSTSPHLQPNIS